MPLFAWSSLAGGFFSGRFTRENLDAFDAYLDELCVETYCFEDNFARFDRARTLAEDRGLSVPQVALAYVLGQPLDVFALVGCNTGEEFADNARAAEASLTPEETTLAGERGWYGGRSGVVRVTRRQDREVYLQEPVREAIV